MFAGKDFLKMTPPKGYKPGIGRGALGFSKRGNIGSKQATKDLSRNPGRFIDAPEEFGLFSSTKVDEDADRVYESIDKRGKRRDRGLGSADHAAAQAAKVSEQEWLNLPEATDVTFRNKRLRQELNSKRRTYAIPDTVLLRDMHKHKLDNFTDDAQSRLSFESDPLKAKQVAETELAHVNNDQIRASLETLTKIDPRNPQGWVGLARCEFESQRLKRARKIIEKGCVHCPHSEEVWVECITLHESQPNVKELATRALSILPTSTKLWKLAISLEESDFRKRDLVHRALETNTENEDLWILAAELESEQDVRRMVLSQGVEFVPESEKLWTELLKLDGSRALFDRALSTCPQSAELWASKFETVEDEDQVNDVVEKAFEYNPATQVDHWLKVIEKSRGFPKVRGFVLDRLNLSSDQIKSLSGDAQSWVYGHMAAKDVDKYLEWAEASEKDEAISILEKALSSGITDAKLWEMYVRLDPSAEVFKRAYESTGTTLYLYQYLWKIPLHQALEEIDKQTKNEWRYYFEKTLLLAKAGEEALTVLKEGISLFKDRPELYHLLHILEPENTADLRQAPSESSIQADLASALVRRGSFAEARSILLAAMSKRSDGRLWLERLRLERAAGREDPALLDRALGECPKYGPLWFEYLQGVAKVKRKHKFSEALKRSGNSSSVLLALALHYEGLGRHDDAKKTVSKALELDRLNVDVWRWYAKLVDPGVEGEYLSVAVENALPERSLACGENPFE